VAKEQRKFADDGWAIWIDGDDTSNVYFNDWLNPKGKSYVDLAIHICRMQVSKALHVYVPFAVSKEEIEDVSLFFQDKKFLQATFSVACIVDYMKNQHTSEIAYNGKTVDIVHISTLQYKVNPLAEGTLIDIDLNELQAFLDNDEAYFIWRMPHKSLDEIFRKRVNVGNVIARLKDLITTPVISEKYNYSIRINEARRLPDEITKRGAFHRQKLNKAVITISIDEKYEMNSTACNLIRHLEENLYQGYIPKDCKYSDMITYQWFQDKEYSEQGHFNFYYNIAKNSISRASMCVYLFIVTAVSCLGSFFANIITYFMGL
jgi:hypothetical protein